MRCPEVQLEKRTVQSMRLYSAFGMTISSLQDNFGNRKFVLTLILNDDGKCRFKIDGEGGKEFLVWQVMRRALDGLFFKLATQPQ